MNTEPTADVLDDMARQASGLSDDLRHYASYVRLYGDLDGVQDAIRVVLDFFANMPMDVLHSRALKASADSKQETNRDGTPHAND